VSAQEKIAKLEGLLSRVQARAAEPRAARAAAPVTVAPAVAEALVVEEPRLAAAEPAVAEPAIAEPAVAELEYAEPEVSLEAPELEIGEEVVEIDSEVVDFDEAEILAAEAAAAEAELAAAHAEPSPPSSRRPRPLEAIAEAQQAAPPHPAPPESGKLVAAAPVPSFDDDFTGVREASQHLPPLSGNEPSLEIESIKPPQAPVRHEMEAELPQGSPGAFTPSLEVAPMPAPAVSTTRPVSDVAPAPPPAAAAAEPIVPERVAARMPSSEQVAQVVGELKPFRPATFGELLDATLGL
jgi:hypothetical protein